MKQHFKKALLELIAVLLIPILLVGFILSLPFLPFDIIKYHRCPYYKHTRRKYSLFITKDNTVALYNRIIKEELPIEYASKDGFEYFIKNGEVLILGYDDEPFDETDGKWVFYTEDADVDKTIPKPMIEYRFKLKEEHCSLPCKFLIFTEAMTKKTKEKALHCPYFYCTESIKTL